MMFYEIELGLSIFMMIFCVFAFIKGVKESNPNGVFVAPFLFFVFLIVCINCVCKLYF